MRSLKDGNLLVKRWEKIGLIEYSYNPKMMAYCLEYATILLPDSNISEYNGMIIPLVFKVINRIKPKFKSKSRVIVKEVIEGFSTFIQENRYLIQDIMQFQSFDWELEICRLFTEQYLISYENNQTILD